MKSSEIKVTHNGVEIQYDETASVWRFVLRGINRHCDTLAGARETIQKPVKKPSTFQRFDAFYWPNYSDPVLVTVTSIADTGGLYKGSRPEVWIQHKERSKFQNRQKAWATDIIPCDAVSNGLVFDYRILKADVDKLRKKMEAIRSKAKCFEPELEPELEEK